MNEGNSKYEQCKYEQTNMHRRGFATQLIHMYHWQIMWAACGRAAIFVTAYSVTYLLFLLPSVVMKIDIPYGVAPSVEQKQIHSTAHVDKRDTEESETMSGVGAY